MEDKKTPPAIIPGYILQNDEISRPQKLLIGIINTLSNNNDGYCKAKNATLASFCGIPKGTISPWLSELVNGGYLKRDIIREGKEVKERHLWLPESKENAKNDTPLESQDTPLENQEGGVEKSRDPSLENPRVNKQGVDKQDKQVTTKDNVSDESEDDSIDYPDGSPEIRATKYLIQKIKDFNSKTPVPKKATSSKMQRWAKAMDRLHRLGPPGGEEGYKWQKIKDIIDYVFDEDDFWPEQIQSATGLRKKIIKLENKYKKNTKKRERKKKSGTRRTFVERDPETGEYKEREANL